MALKTSKHLKSEIANRLRCARIEAGYKSMRDFALTGNIPVSTYIQHEQGIRKISIKYLLIYNQLLNIDVDWLLSGEKKAEAINLSEKITKLDFNLYIEVLRKVLSIKNKSIDKITFDLSVQIYNNVVCLEESNRENVLNLLLEKKTYLEELKQLRNA